MSSGSPDYRDAGLEFPIDAVAPGVVGVFRRDTVVIARTRRQAFQFVGYVGIGRAAEDVPLIARNNPTQVLGRGAPFEFAPGLGAAR